MTSAMFNLRQLLVLLAAVLAAPVAASEGDVARTEIEHLIAHLGSSGCRFNRNGAWHTSERAVSHLKNKYEYLLKRDLVPNAEAFIERAATESSVSGKPYLVKCGDSPAVPSARWLRDELERFRAGEGEQH